MAKNERVTREDEAWLTEERRDEITIPDEYKTHRDEFLQLLSEFEDMGDGHLRSIKAARYWIELTFSDICPAHSTVYRAGPIPRHLAEKKLQMMLQEEVIEPGNTEWANFITLVPKKDG